MIDTEDPGGGVIDTEDPSGGGGWLIQMTYHRHQFSAL